MFLLQPRVCLLLSKNSQNEGARGMATLKAISIRLKSVKNIQKITQSMKMVSAAKYARAERELKQVKPMGEGIKAFYENAEIGKVEEEKKEAPAKNLLYVAVTSDRGLCGAVHTSVAKIIRTSLIDPGENIKIICIGDKCRSMLQRTFGKNILFVCQEVGRLPPTFQDASIIANEILQSEFEYHLGKIVYNKFRSVVSYVTEEMNFYSLETILDAPKVQNYEGDGEDEDGLEEVMVPFAQFSLTAMIYYAMKEGACSEQSSRMTAMDNASKNAGDMIGKLTLTFNRTRQAVITRELIEIISGASAL